MAEVSEKDKFLSLKEYIAIAKQIIGSTKFKFLLKSEDAISSVVEAIAWADSKFIPQLEGYDKPGTKEGFRAAHARWAIINYWKSLKKSKKHKHKSLKHYIGRQQIDLDSFPSIYPTLKSFLCNSLVEYVKTSSFLSDSERKSIIKFYLENMTQVDIAKDLGLSKQAVAQSIKSGIDKLRWRFNDSARK